MPQPAESSAVLRTIREGKGDGGAAPGIVKGRLEAVFGEVAADRRRQALQRLGPVSHECGDPETGRRQRRSRLRFALGPGRVEERFAGRQRRRHQGGEPRGVDATTPRRHRKRTPSPRPLRGAAATAA